MDPAARLLRLLSLLQARPTWPASELAERLGVDRRTIRRDVARLRTLGYPVDSTPGLAGYRLGPGSRLPPLLLDDDEAVAIALGLRLAASTAVGGIESAAVAAMAKLDQVLPALVRDRVRSLHASTVHVDTPLTDPVDADALTLLARACRGSERVRFSYRAFGDLTTSRRVEPAQIVHASRRWYLVARDLDRDDWRTFRIDRISELALTGHRFERRDPPDATRRVRDALEFAPQLIEAEIVVDLAPEIAKRRFVADGAKVEVMDGGRTLVRIGAASLEQLARYAISLPAGFEVISPPELRQRMQELGTLVATRHGTVEGRSDSSADQR